MGLTTQGYQADTAQEILGDVIDDVHANVDATLDLTEEQPLGQVVGIVCSKQAEIEELNQTFANAMNPNGAENFLLDNICALSGTFREKARSTIVTLNCNVNDNFSAAAGTITTNVLGHDERFVNISDVGPLTPAGVYPIDFQCSSNGPINVFATTLTTITAPVSGLNSVINPEDGQVGAFDETDTSLRLRREAERTSGGGSTTDSIRAKILQVKGVQQCFVIENELSTPDPDTGLPGKSIEVVIYDGITPAAADIDIGNIVWANKPSGGQTFGSTSVTVKDARGDNRVVNFSRATVRQVWLSFDVFADPNTFPSNGATLIKQTVAIQSDSYQNLGVDVFSVRYKAAALSVTGMLDVPALRLGFAAAPTGTTNLPITGREIADIDTSRIDVNITTGAP